MTILSIRKRKMPVPTEHRTNFRHLYFDIAWFGVLSGSTLSFIAVYMARVGASAFQIGMFNASPAMITLLFALPSGQWLKNRPLGHSVFWSATLFRFFYLLWILIPVFIESHTQVWLLIGSTLLMSIPGTLLSISFNALFADAVPANWRAHVAGIRNAALAISFIFTSLLCGYLLNELPFPLGYQVVFGIGFLGAAMSTLHLRFIRLETPAMPRIRTGNSLGDHARPGVVHSLGNAIRITVGLRFLSRRRRPHFPSFQILRNAFGTILLILGLFHLTLYLPSSLYPLYWVDNLNLTDAEISLGNALFYLAVFVISTQLSRLTNRTGNHAIMVIGALFLSVYPWVTAVMQDVTLFWINSVLGGIGWSLAFGAVNNYLLEFIPDNDRPVHLAWYNLTIHAAILISSFMGPVLATQLGLVAAMILSGGARLFSALAIWRWGKSKELPA